MKQKIQTLLGQLNHGLVEREATLKTALLTVLAGENLVLIGPPGTGKSLIARRIAESFSHHDNHGSHDKNGYFEYLLTKFSTPEEIFGPLSITELKADRFKRNTTGYLPAVKMAFLDEIFKASSSILNALLTILNERIYHNGSEPQAVPLQALIAASNELPTDQEELSALYDRFLVRGFVDYVSQDNLPRLFEKAGAMPALSQLTAVDLDTIQRNAESVTLPPEVAQAMLRIWTQHKETFKEDRRESLSDRRLKKVIKLLCVSAATNGRSEVDLSDVFLLKDCLWNHQENALKVRELIFNTLRQSHGSTVSTPHEASASAVDSAKLTEVEVPDIGDFDKVTVIELLVKVGDSIKVKQSLITVESDKASMEISSSQSGIVKEIKVKLGDKIKQGSLVLLVEATGAITAVPTATEQVNSKLNAVIRGFNGSGTAQDPLLIQTVEDLMDLSRPDVGLKGYYFRQTTDIDCTGLSSWTSIDFKGHYDGGGHTIKYIQVKKSGRSGAIGSWISVLNNDHTCFELFNKIQIQSSIINLKLEDLRLALNTEDSQISHCFSNLDLIEGNATNCTITACESGGSLIHGDASNCTIRDCLVTMNCNGKANEHLGGISQSLTQGSIAERCFVTGKYTYTGDGYFYFSGITSTNDASIIRQCAVGKLDKNSTDVRIFRIVEKMTDSSVFENNASIDTNPGTDEVNGKSGKTVAAALFKQRYFEYTLGWDFDNVWKWDDKEDRPALRSVGLGATWQASQPTEQKANMTDLLTQQMRANIWL